MSENGRWIVVKWFRVSIRKTAGFNIYDILTFFDEFIKSLNPNAKTTSVKFCHSYYRKGYLKLDNILTYRKSISTFLKEYDYSTLTCNDIFCMVKIDKKMFSLSYGELFELDNKLTGYSLSLFDDDRVTGEDDKIDRKLLRKLRKCVDKKYIIKAEINDYKGSIV